MMGNSSKHAPPVCRRTLLRAGGMLGVLALAAPGSLRLVASAAAAPVEPFAPVPMPAQMPVREGMAQLAGARLWFWDTGGGGEPIVLLHPASGSALIWGYQQPAFVKAGYRVIAYSRRGYFNSDPIDKSKPGTGSQDLHDLAEFLGIGRFHLVASAAGGSVASDYAFSRPERLRSLTVSSNSFGVVDGEIFAAAQRIKPRGWDEMPVEFREVGPSYRGANPEGFRLWVEIARKSYLGDPFRQPLANRITEAKLGQLEVPTLVICGAADLATPPSIARMLQAKIRGSELVVAPETGHSVYWEQPDLFNHAVLDHVAKHAD